MMRCMALTLLAVAVAGEKRLIETAPGVRKWMTEEEMMKLMGRPGQKNNFMDVTDTINATRKVQALEVNARVYPNVGAHHHYVNSIINEVNMTSLVATIETLAAYHTRYYTTQTGVDAVMQLLEMYRQSTPEGRNDVRVELFFHAFAQPSIIVRVEGQDPAVREETVIIGGHIDSINLGGVLRAPGADDDGTGSASVLEIFRTLMRNQFRPARTVEFHAYAAEEVGLRGSADIARDYAVEGRNVYSMLQMDMTGYTNMAVPAIGLIDDQTDPMLNQWLETAIDYYLTIGYQHSLCGYGCSDHASWMANGYPASFPFETPFGQHNPQIHTANDVLANLNTTHMFEFVKLGTAFVCEMACPSNTEGCT